MSEAGGASRSTNPAHGSSSATDVSLREYVMAALDASRCEFREGLRHLHESIAATNAAQEMAVNKALVSIDKRFEAVNEFRGALTDLSHRMATKDSLDGLTDKIAAADAALETRFESLYQRNRDDIEKVQTRLNLREGQDEGSRLTKGSLYTAIAAAVGLLGLLVVLANLLTTH